LDDARQQYEAALAMYERVAAAQPIDTTVRIGLANSRQRLGDVLAEMRKTEEAAKNYQEGLRVAEAVLASDAANPNAKTLRLTCRIRLGLEKAEVVVRKTSPHSQAEQVGLREGDVLVRYAGKPVVCAADLPVLTGRAIGTGIELEIRRDGAPLKLAINAGPLGAICEDRILAGERPR
jgi:S1-C subfamily serine protease